MKALLLIGLVWGSQIFDLEMSLPVKPGHHKKMTVEFEGH
jgi:hypothetical protein